ncbi:hypothetical protein PENTCL1PPCAC_4470, partial [Pristionchus entomophagus]
MERSKRSEIIESNSNANYDSPVQSIDNEDSSSIGQLRITDLPLLILLNICAYLRPANYRNDEGPCKNLYNFRNTCRRFASAVGKFFENC